MSLLVDREGKLKKERERERKRNQCLVLTMKHRLSNVEFLGEKDIT